MERGSTASTRAAVAGNGRMATSSNAWACNAAEADHEGRHDGVAAHGDDQLGAGGGRPLDSTRARPLGWRARGGGAEGPVRR